MTIRTLAVSFVALSALCGAADATTVYWAGLTGDTTNTVSGSINAPSGTVGVTFTGSYVFDQLNNVGTDYWVDSGNSTSYTDGGLINRPTGVDIVALSQGGLETIDFSSPVTDPYLALVSWNGNVTEFAQNFTVLTQGCGYWGCGTFQINAPNSFTGIGEATGILQFTGTFSEISFYHTSEDWHGLTVGIADVAPTTGEVPEPLTLSLFGAGLAGLALRRRRR